MDLDCGIREKSAKKLPWKTVLTLAYQSLGVVYGDLIISPLYVYKSTFAEDIEHTENNDEIYGVFSLVFWALTLIPLIKYVFIVLKADDNGEGGTFALYSLLSRHARVSLLHNRQLADEELTGYKNGDCNVIPERRFASRIKMAFEKHKVLQKILLVLALIGTSMVIGDGVFTPSLSVFSAVSGLELSMSKEHHRYVEIPAVCIILIGLFALQHYGTHRVGFLFAPIIITWLFCISAIGVYNIFYWNPQVYVALSPYYVFRFLKKTRGQKWMSLGGILLCITGSEAMFADLGHFSQSSIKLAFTSVVYPSIVLAYMGQAAYLSKHHIITHSHHFGFYASVPDKLRWPVLVIAILAAVVGSQAMITATFSTIRQCLALSCFPRVKVVHTSSTIHGQIYIPDINWLLMLLCLAVTIGFQDTKHLGNAAGLAVITVMLVTTILMSLVIVVCWKQRFFIAIGFVVIFGTVEAVFFSASLVKFHEGAWVSIVLAIAFFAVMYIWHYGTLKKYEYDVQNKVSIDWLLGLSPSIGIVRVPGISLIQTDLVSGIPGIFSHFVTNLPAFHQVVVFLCIKHVPVPHVSPKERYLVGRVGPREFRLYRCIVRYGYRNVHKDDMEFEKDLMCSIAEFIRTGNTTCPEFNSTSPSKELEQDEIMAVVGTCSTHTMTMREFLKNQSNPDLAQTSEIQPKKRVRFVVPESPRIDNNAREELNELQEAREGGVVYITGQSYMRAKAGSSLLKKLVISVGYELLRKNSRAPSYVPDMPHASSLEVAMMYQI